MTSTMPLLILMLIMLSASLFYLVKAEGGFRELPRLLDRVGVSAESIDDVKSRLLNIFSMVRNNEDRPEGWHEFVSGESRYSQGVCQKDADCEVTGCSGEVCANTDVVTPCVWSDDYPNAQGYSCGCVSEVCGWRK